MAFSLTTPTVTSAKNIAHTLSKVTTAVFVITVLFSNGFGFSQELVSIDTGNAIGEMLGFDVALSGDRKTMAVGAYAADPNGYVRLYDNNGTDWNVFQQLDGPDPESTWGFGYSLDLSYDGSVLIVGSYNRAVRVYEFSDSSPPYSLLNTTADYVYAYEVSVSGDGRVFGVASWHGARIFARIGNGFQERESTFVGYGSISGIALNYNGTIAIIGDVDWSSGRGRAGVFQWIGSESWMQMGSDFVGDAPNDRLGDQGCVSITHDGLTVAIGAPWYDGDGEDEGLVRVSNYATTEDTWKNMPDLIGDHSYAYESATSLSSDGKYLAVGASRGSYVKMFKKNGTNYDIIGEKVALGESAFFGYSVDMAADGAAVAIGAYAFDDAKGRTYLLLSNSLTRTPTSVPTKEPSVVPTTSPSVVPTEAASKTNFALTFLSDDTSIDFNGTSPDKEIIIKTLISNKAPRDSFEQTILVGTDCQSKFVDEYPDDTTLVSISNDETLDEVEAKNIKVTSAVNIDTTTIAFKGVHATDPDNKSVYFEYEEGDEDRAKIEFCIRTDYGKVDVTNSDGSIIESSVNFYIVKVTVTFLLQIGFTSASVSIAEAEESKVEQAGTAVTELNACDCPAAAASKVDCFDTPVEYDQNDILSVCVYDPTENYVITSFKDVTLGNGQISTQVIDSDGKPTSLASVSKLNEGMAMVNTRIISAFFDVGNGASPAAVAVSGVAVIGFNTASTRKLTTVGVKGGKDMRKLQDDNEAAVEDEGAFDVEVLLSNDEQMGGSPGFDVLENFMTLVVLTMIPIVLS